MKYELHNTGFLCDCIARLELFIGFNSDLHRVNTQIHLHTERCLFGSPCRWNFTTFFIFPNSIHPASHIEEVSKWSPLTPLGPCCTFCSSCRLFSSRGRVPAIWRHNNEAWPVYFFLSFCQLALRNNICKRPFVNFVDCFGPPCNSICDS